MKHKYRIEVLEKVEGSLIVTAESTSFVADYATARATLMLALDIAVSQLDHLPYIDTCVVTPIGNVGARLTWTYTNGDQFIREVDLVRIGDA